VTVTSLLCCLQPEAPLVLSSTSGSIATLVWQIALKENVLEKVQDELAQVGAISTNSYALLMQV
jgi:hypothetical protein